MTESIVIVGAGMAGSLCALALAKKDYQITLLERDAPLPTTSADQIFLDWRRWGIAQTRHTHAFRARFCGLLRQEYPDLYRALLAAGAREVPVIETLSPKARARFVPMEQDAELRVLASRRSTMEMVFRQYLSTLPNVALRCGAKVQVLDIDRSSVKLPVVRGVKVGADSVRADVVIDASGRGSNSHKWLTEAGVTVPSDVEDCRLYYFSRFYRLHSERPAPNPWSRVGDLGYLKYGVIDADADWFSVTLAVPDCEQEIRAAVQRPEVFDAICEALPGVAAWTQHAKPMTSVAGMGAPTWRRIFSRWSSIFSPREIA